MHGEFKLVSKTLDLCIEAAPDPLYENIIHVPAPGYSEPPATKDSREGSSHLGCAVHFRFEAKPSETESEFLVFFSRFVRMQAKHFKYVFEIKAK
jgi:hypothetical protein